jgi:hypothetical protein
MAPNLAGSDLGFVNFITLVLKNCKEPGVTCNHKIVLKAINQSKNLPSLKLSVLLQALS